jgi:hypothetical protein
MSREGIIPKLEQPTRENFDRSYNRISSSDWNKYGAEMAVWLAGVKFAENRIKKELISKKKSKPKP